MRGFAAALSAVRMSGAPERERTAAVSAAFDKYVDLERVAQRVLGPYWRDAAEHRKEMRDVLRGYLLKRLAGAMGGADNSPVEVAAAAERPWGADSLVNAQISFSPGQARTLGFLLSRDGAHARIYDVIVSGVSAVDMLSSECQSIMRRDGMPALLARLGQ